jgi:hypothetical protein
MTELSFCLLLLLLQALSCCRVVLASLSWVLQQHHE